MQLNCKTIQQLALVHHNATVLLICTTMSIISIRMPLIPVMLAVNQFPIKAHLHDNSSNNFHYASKTLKYSHIMPDSCQDLFLKCAGKIITQDGRKEVVGLHTHAPGDL